jgi:membrane fusion protein (multidrug efflux system)
MAMVVNAKGEAEIRILKTDRAIGNQWLITSGLAPGDQVIVEGLQKVRPGVPVRIAQPAPATK